MEGVTRTVTKVVLSSAKGVKRADLIGGRVELRSGPDGTAFQLILPVKLGSERALQS